MDEVNECNNLAIILNIIEGTGLNVRKDSVIIKASLGGNTLETDAVTPGEFTTTFNSKLIWSTNKDSVKRMKEENQPIKLECFMPSTENEFDLIGFVLIQMRGIPFWNCKKSGMMKPHWYKMLGVSHEWKLLKPELLLCVTITDNENFDPISMRSAEIENTQQVKHHANVFASQSGLNIKLMENKCIKIETGNLDTHEFLVNIHIKSAEYFDQIFPNNSEHLKDNIKLKYALFEENCIRISQHKNTGQYLINETIQLKFQSTLKDLITYFRKIFFISIDFLLGNSIIGSSHLSFGAALLPLPSSIIDFEQLYSMRDHTYNFDDYSKIAASNNSISGTDSIICYSFSLKLLKKSIESMSLKDITSPPATASSKQSDSIHQNNRPVVISSSAKQSTEKEIESIRQSYLLPNSEESNRSIPRTCMCSVRNEDLTYKIVEELEDWKQNQKKQFSAALKRQETCHLTRLSNEWQRKCREHENKLTQKIEHCDSLTKVLEEAHGTLKERNRADAEYEKKLLKSKHEMEKDFAIKINLLHERIKRMEDKRLQQNRTVEIRFKELEMQKTEVVRENEKLRAKVRHLENILQDSVQRSVPHEKVAMMEAELKILREKLGTVQKSKLFYKEKWAILVREIQKMKFENNFAEKVNDDRIPRLNDLINSARKEISAGQTELEQIKDMLRNNL